MLTFQIAMLVLAGAMAVGAVRWSTRDGSDQERGRQAAFDRELGELLDHGDRG
jgi:hypothetical protein